MAWTGRFKATPGSARGRRMVELGSSLVPSKVTFVADDNGGVALVAHFEIRDGRPECVGFHVESKPKGRGIRTADLGIFNIDGMVDAAFSTFAVGTGGTPLTGPRPAEQVAATSREVHRARKGRPRATTRAELERVAQVYREHVDASPVQAVRHVCGYGSERTAARRVEQARAAGLLPKTTPGKRRA